MKFTAYILTSALLRILAVLPPFILYRISDVFYLILSRITRYRRAIIKKNLQRSFPELNELQLRVLRKKFYTHLADVILENAVTQYYPKRKLQKLYHLKNPDLLDSFFIIGRHIILVTGHYNNWEWAAPLSYSCRHLVLAVYMPLKNPYFDRAYRKVRTRFGAEAVPMGNVGRRLFELDEQNKPTLIGMVGDQRPIRKHVQYWTRFLNQDTAVFTGSERLAKKFNAAVIFMKVRKVKRGKYEAEFTLLTDTPKETGQYEITEQYTRMLETLIKEKPENWLWSHNRWKISYEEWLKKK